MKDLVTIKLIQQAILDGFVSTNYVNDETSRRMWWIALEIIQKDYLSSNYMEGGLWIASPLPAIKENKFLGKFKGWLWAPDGFPYFNNDTAKCLPHKQSEINNRTLKNTSNYRILNLNSNDSFEPFVMIITPKFQCILAISGEKDKRFLIMRSDVNSLNKIIKLVEMKLRQENLEEAINFQNHLRTLGELCFDSEFTQNFWPKLSIKLARLIPSMNLQESYKEQSNKTLQVSEAKLLEAISHEVRTPLATIRTLISSTLKKYNMDETIRGRLVEIDNECTEQIDRFGLIFNAAELVSGDSSPSQLLTSINLGEILKKLFPHWKKQLSRRGIMLNIDIPDELPDIFSNSEKLELMLRGLIDKNTRGLKPGSTLSLELRPAGQKLKLQLILEKEDIHNKTANLTEDSSDIGPVLNWNPKTGSLQLSQSATQKLLASLGGRVAKRKDSGLTVFFPISDIN